MNWQPIETAPKDGTDILVWYSGAVRVTRWYVHYMNGHPDLRRAPEWDQDVMYGPSYYGPMEPTHWMPLPQPPEQSK